MTDAEILIKQTVFSPTFHRATFAGKQRSQAKLSWQKVTIRPVQIKGLQHLQFSYFDGRKTHVHNDNSEARLRELLAADFAGVHLTTSDEEIDIRTTKKGDVNIGRSKTATVQNRDTSHNRIKDYPLPEGKADHLLEVIGISTSDGKIKPTMRAKFVQINEFLKHLTHSLDDAIPLAEPDSTISILDCGCGSSYLTFAAHHYLNNIANRKAKLIGVDVNDNLIRASLAKAEHLSANVDFLAGKIGSTTDIQADVVLALHACDTATDDAIAQAIRSNAKLFLGVPCCHRAVNQQLRSEPTVLKPILKHGITRERLADLVTDSFRALALRIMGYRTEIVEFVSSEYTAKNLMIRATKTSHSDPTAVAEYQAMKQFWGIVPEIEKRQVLQL